MCPLGTLRKEELADHSVPESVAPRLVELEHQNDLKTY